jgi:hypothetical protein
MDAKIIDTRDGSASFTYLDWHWSPETTQTDDRFGCVRAQKDADRENACEAAQRFVVEPVLPRIGQRCKVKAYNAIRRGVVTAVKARGRRVEVRVLWHNKKGDPHEHWYSNLDLRWAETFARKVSK